MPRFGLIIGAALPFLFLALAFADTHVKGYVRRDGTYVDPHWRSSPNGSTLDNWSTRGNVNPYTGEPGSKNMPEGYRRIGPPPQPTSPVYVSPPLNERGKGRRLSTQVSYAPKGEDDWPTQLGVTCADEICIVRSLSLSKCTPTTPSFFIPISRTRTGSEVRILSWVDNKLELEVEENHDTRNRFTLTYKDFPTEDDEDAKIVTHFSGVLVVQDKGHRTETELVPLKADWEIFALTKRDCPMGFLTVPPNGKIPLSNANRR